MKYIRIYLAIVVFSLSFIECAAPPRPPRPPHPSNRSALKPMPPGQAKKVFGTKSAKPFAPGQNK
ncbi:hypothetical protein ACFO4P_06680 [Epilithonimonas pallida]|uniref:hypothetical protein n=1 Tax=Epilithonimonas pallida TaxID=373671 RepID=UPI00360E5413